MSFTVERLGSMLDFSTFPVVDELMSIYGPEPSYLTFSAPGVARLLQGYGRTVLAYRSAFGDPLQDERPPGMEVRVAGPEDMMAFPPNRFGFVHLRWTPVRFDVLSNVMRWLRPGGVLLVESPDPYPALNLPRGPYQAVASSVLERLDISSSSTLPAHLIRAGLKGVGCKHDMPNTVPSNELLADLVKQGEPWPDLMRGDLEHWQEDPATDTPFLMNVMAWGVKPND